MNSFTLNTEFQVENLFDDAHFIVVPPPLFCLVRFGSVLCTLFVPLVQVATEMPKITGSNIIISHFVERLTTISDEADTTKM